MDDKPLKVSDWSQPIEVIIETPKMSLIKYKDDGSIDYISPVPCPFNYGSVPNTISGDGDRIDAIILGKKLKGGTHKISKVRGVIEFYDKGEYDPKYVCSDNEITKGEKITLLVFFRFFSLVKIVLNKLRGKNGRTAFEIFRNK